MKLIAGVFLILALLDSFHCAPLVGSDGGTYKDTATSSSWGYNVGLDTNIGLEGGFKNGHGSLGIYKHVGADVGGHKRNGQKDIHHPFTLQHIQQYPQQYIPTYSLPYIISQYLPRWPQGAPQYIPPYAPQYIPPYAPQGAPQYTPQYAPQGTPQVGPQYNPQVPPQYVPQGAPEKATQKAPQYDTTAAPLDTTQYGSQGAIN